MFYARAGSGRKAATAAAPSFLLLDAEVISIRHSADKMPILLKAEGDMPAYT